MKEYLIAQIRNGKYTGYELVEAKNEKEACRIYCLKHFVYSILGEISICLGNYNKLTGHIDLKKSVLIHMIDFDTLNFIEECEEFKKLSKKDNINRLTKKFNL